MFHVKHMPLLLVYALEEASFLMKGCCKNALIRLKLPSYVYLSEEYEHLRPYMLTPLQPIKAVNMCVGV